MFRGKNFIVNPTIEILEKINQNSLKNNEEVFTRLYRYLLRPDIYYVACKNWYANNGSFTKGINNDTADEFSEEKIQYITNSFADNSYYYNSELSEICNCYGYTNNFSRLTYLSYLFE